MTFTRSLGTALALCLAACGSAGQPAPEDWRAALGSGDAIAAEAALKRELASGTPPAELAPFLGEAALRQGDLDDARRWLAKAEFAPDVAGHGFHMLGRLRMLEGDLPGAGQAFDSALGSLGNDPALWVDIARLRYRGGEQAQALEAAEKALSLGPDNPAALLLSAQMVRDSSGNATALPLLERGLAVTPGDPDLLADYAATLGELGRAKDMLAAVRRFAAAAPGDRRALYLQAVLAARAGNHDLARGLIQRSGNLDRQMPAAILLLGIVDLDNGNPASAAQGFDRLLSGQPDNMRARALLARALWEAGNNRELVARFAAAADDRYTAMLVGRAYERLGDRKKAAPYLDRAFGSVLPPHVVRLAPTTSVDAASQRGSASGANTVALVRALLRSGRSGEARSRAEGWLKRHPGSADAMGLAGDVAFAAGDPRAALRHYRAAAAIRRPWPLAKRMAAALETSGDVRAAGALVSAHLAGEPNNAEAAAMLARRFAARGERAHAGALLKHARSHGGG
jgi:tetratricopeptide (TPR) repeat protein